MNPIQLFKTISEPYKLLFCPSCVHCGRLLLPTEKHICLHCINELALLCRDATTDKIVDSILWGRVQVDRLVAFMHFVKGGISQDILHALKYKGLQEIGVWVGEMFGLQLKEDPYFQQVDCLVPVPLHPKKLHSRGYNQTQLIAEGIAKQLECQIAPEVLKRVVSHTTQTHKSRIERWENVDKNFALNTEVAPGKHLLLIDDVLTTGATLEACASALLQLPGVRVSIACIAKA